MSGEVDAFIGLGSNLGDREAHLEAAFRDLAALPDTSLRARSSLYESAPVGAGGGDYLNAVAQLRTELAPIDLLAALQAIETSHGRVRPFANAPRTLDLDLLLHGDASVHTAVLTLPHPRLHERAFVVLPLAEIAPEMLLPDGRRVGDLLRGLGSQRVAKLMKP